MKKIMIESLINCFPVGKRYDIEITIPLSDDAKKYLAMDSLQGVGYDMPRNVMVINTIMHYRVKIFKTDSMIFNGTHHALKYIADIDLHNDYKYINLYYILEADDTFRCYAYRGNKFYFYRLIDLFGRPMKLEDLKPNNYYNVEMGSDYIIIH